MKENKQALEKVLEPNSHSQIEEIPFRVSYRDFSSSDAITTAIQEKVQKLARFHARITDCEIVISAPHKHSMKSKYYHIEIRCHLPGGPLVVTREPEKNDSHMDIYVCIRDAFLALERIVQNHIKIQRGLIKHHENHEPASPLESVNSGG